MEIAWWRKTKKMDEASQASQAIESMAPWVVEYSGLLMVAFLLQVELALVVWVGK